MTRTLRRATVLALALTMALGGVAQAKGAPALVTGFFTYTFNGTTRTAALVASGANPAMGMFVWTVPATRQYAAGPVTCVTVDGPDAWIAAPLTRSSFGPEFGGVLVRVRDGDRGGAGDVVSFGLEDTAADALNACVTKSRELDAYLAPVIVGDITVRSGR